MKLRMPLILVCSALGANISYNDIINQAPSTAQPYVNNSPIATAFNGLSPRADRISCLEAFGDRQPDGSSVITLTDVPTIDRAQLKNLSLRMSLGKAGQEEKPRDMPSTHKVHQLEIFAPQQPSLKLLLGIWYQHDAVGRLNGILPAQKPGNARGPDDVSGATLMRVWDGLCSLCKVGNVELEDYSTLPEDWGNDIHLSLLYPYMWSSTFYEKFGYTAKRGSPQKVARYEQAKNFLIYRPALEILEDFKDQPAIFNALMEGYNELQYFPESNKPLSQAIMGDFIRVPFARVKTLQKNSVDLTTSKDQAYYLGLLKTIYMHCLQDYKSSNYQKNREIGKWQAVLTENDMFEKKYR